MSADKSSAAGTKEPIGPAKDNQNRNDSANGSLQIIAGENRTDKHFENIFKIHQCELGVLYRATDRSSKQAVVLKTVKQDEVVLKAFSQEVNSIAGLEHPNIAKIIGYREPFCVVEHLKSTNLDQFFLKYDAFEEANEVGDLIVSICEALSHAHRNGLVHARLKPNKIHFVKENDKIVIKLIGFGGANAQAILQNQGLLSVDSPYMSPVQRRNSKATAQSDIYSLGAIAYQMVTGNLPSDELDSAEDRFECLTGMIERDAPNLSHAKTFGRIISQALADEGHEQYETVDQIKEDVRTWLRLTRGEFISRTDEALVSDNDEDLKDTDSWADRVPVSTKELAQGDVSPQSIESESDEDHEALFALEAIPGHGELELEETGVFSTPPFGAGLDLLPSRAQGTPVSADTAENNRVCEAVEASPPDRVQTSPDTVPQTGVRSVPCGLTFSKEDDLDLLLSQSQARIESSPTVVPDPAAEKSCNDDPLVNQTLFDRYLVLDVLAESDIAVVYAAKDLKDDRLVSVKTLKSGDASARQAFAKEVKATSTISHQNIIKFIDFKETADQTFYIMEFVEAPTLRELLNSIKKIETEEQIGATLLQVCEAIGSLHEKDSAHGNIGPDNILFLEEEGRVISKIGGFGTKSLRQGQGDSGVDWRNSYYPPRHKTTISTAKADIYAIGALAYHMASGRLPFETCSTDSLTRNTSERKSLPLTLLRPDLFGAKALDQIISRAMHPDSSEGYNTVLELQTDVVAWLQAVRKEMSDTKITASHANLKTLRDWSKSREVRSLDSEDDGGQFQNMFGLKTTQVKGEESFASRLARRIAWKGRRESPIASLVQLIVLTVGGGLVAFAVMNYALLNFDNLRSNYLSMARTLSNEVRFSGGSKEVLASAPEKSRTFTYNQDPTYERWTKAKEVKRVRRVEPSGRLREK